MSQLLYIINEFPYFAMHVVMMDLFKLWRSHIYIYNYYFDILFMFVIFKITLKEILTICSWNRFRFYHHLLL